MESRWLISPRYPYSKLKAPNVQGTIDALSLCAAGRPKSFVFVSSTSVLDNDYYVNLSDRLSMEGRPGIPESDDLDGSSTGLGMYRSFVTSLANIAKQALVTAR